MISYYILNDNLYTKLHTTIYYMISYYILNDNLYTKLYTTIY
jgi:hypothetical protein